MYLFSKKRTFVYLFVLLLRLFDTTTTTNSTTNNNCNNEMDVQIGKKDTEVWSMGVGGGGATNTSERHLAPNIPVKLYDLPARRLSYI